MIEGMTLKIGGAEYIIPPLNFRQLKKLYPVIEQMQKTDNPMDQMQAVVTIAQAALSRNYPEMTIEQVEEMIDLNNIRQVIEAIMGISGFLRGEAVRGSVQTGAASMAT